jgi:hypothetical protein
VCDSAGVLVRSRRVICSCFALCCCGGCSLFSVPGMILVYPFYRLKEVQSYKMLAGGVTLLKEEPRGLRRALSGDDVVRMASVLLALLLCV